MEKVEEALAGKPPATVERRSPLVEGGKAWAQRLYAEQYARLTSLALRAEALGRMEEAAYWRRHAEAAARAMREVQLGTLTVNVYVDRVESPADEVRLARKVGLEVASQVNLNAGGL